MMIEMFQNSMTLTEIGKALGVSRSAVAGAIHRARMRGEKISVLFEKDGTPVPQKIEPPKPIKARVKKGARRRKIPQLVLPFIDEIGGTLDDFIFDEMPAGVKGVTIMLLKSSSCRYILPDKYANQSLYCGETIHRNAFCEQHFKMCYAKVSDVKAGYKIKLYASR